MNIETCFEPDELLAAGIDPSCIKRVPAGVLMRTGVRATNLPTWITQNGGQPPIVSWGARLDPVCVISGWKEVYRYSYVSAEPEGKFRKGTVLHSDRGLLLKIIATAAPALARYQFHTMDQTGSSHRGRVLASGEAEARSLAKTAHREIYGSVNDPLLVFISLSPSNPRPFLEVSSDVNPII